jgi:hypothetical protein
VALLVLAVVTALVRLASTYSHFAVPESTKDAPAHASAEARFPFPIARTRTQLGEQVRDPGCNEEALWRESEWARLHSAYSSMAYCLSS